MNCLPIVKTKRIFKLTIQILFKTFKTNIILFIFSVLFYNNTIYN